LGLSLKDATIVVRNAVAAASAAASAVASAAATSPGPLQATFYNQSWLLSNEFCKSWKEGEHYFQ
jgi:hypothetical protein